MIPYIPLSLAHAMQQGGATLGAQQQQRLGGLGLGLIGNSRGLQSFGDAYGGLPINKKLTFKEELQDEIDSWLRDI